MNAERQQAMLRDVQAMVGPSETVRAVVPAQTGLHPTARKVLSFVVVGAWWLTLALGASTVVVAGATTLAGCLLVGMLFSIGPRLLVFTDTSVVTMRTGRFLDGRRTPTSVIQRFPRMPFDARRSGRWGSVEIGDEHFWVALHSLEMIRRYNEGFVVDSGG